MLIIPANSASAAGGYAVANSARFQTASLKRSAGSKTNATKATISMWFKRSELVDCVLMQSYTDDSNRAYIKLLGNTFYFFDRSGGTTRNYWVSTFVLRDVSAFYHLHINIDTGNGTAANRFIVHLNGVNQPVANFTNNATYGSGVTSNWQQASGTNQFTIGANESVNDQYFGGYMSEVVYLDGQVVAYDSFGEFDEDSGIWKPIDGLADLTVGNTGFYLDFEDSSALGADVIGSNDFTAAGLAAIDQTTDTCTNNFCTMNPLDTYNSPTITDGNTVCNAGSSDKSMRSTIGISSGKWYWEVNTTANNSANMGIINGEAVLTDGNSLQSVSTNSVIWEGNGGLLFKNGSSVTTAYSGGTSTYGFALDLDNGTLKLSQNGTFYNSGNAVVTSITADTYLPFFAPNGGGSPTTFKANFGNPAYAISSGNADGNGHGNFEYAVPSGYYSLNTKNLAEYG